jgi:hypothetical protein
MSVGKSLVTGAAVSGAVLLPVMCCAGLSLIVGLGSAAVSAWLVTVGYIVAPIALLAAAAAVVVLYRRRRSAITAGDCCGGNNSVKRMPT